MHGASFEFYLRQRDVSHRKTFTCSPAQASERAAKEDAEVQTRLQRQEEALAAARAAAATAEGDAQVGFMKQS